MDSFDYIIVAIGVALIVIGLLLFILGKRDSQSENHVEGFGIKLNVSNPSIILIVFGIGLVLFPRLMPNTQISQPPTDTLQPTDARVSNDTQPNVTRSEPTTSANGSTPDNAVAVDAFLPTGLWYLTQYEENGVDLSNNVEGNIRFDLQQPGVLGWVVDLIAVDGWGNVANYQYRGVITARNGRYSIETQSSTDPGFVRQGATPLILQMDNSTSLHMEYFFNGSTIVIHWSQ